VRVPIAFKQSSPGIYGLKPITQSFTDGPALFDHTPQLFPLRPNWAKQVTAGGASVEVERNELGFGGESADVYYPQASKRALQLGYTLAVGDRSASLSASSISAAGRLNLSGFRELWQSAALPRLPPARVQASSWITRPGLVTMCTSRSRLRVLTPFCGVSRL
jgi:hypothetical protein